MNAKKQLLLNKIINKIKDMNEKQVDFELNKIFNKNQVDGVIIADILSTGEIIDYSIEECYKADLFSNLYIEDEIKHMIEDYEELLNTKIVLLVKVEIEGNIDFFKDDYREYLNLIDYYILDKNIEQYCDYDNGSKDDCNPFTNPLD